MQVQEDTSKGDQERSATRQPDQIVEEMLNAIGDSPSNLASSDDREDGEAKQDEEDTELGKRSEDDEHSWVMGTISKTVQHHMKSFGQKQMKKD